MSIESTADWLGIRAAAAVGRLTLDALEREESCGGHFREEYQTEDGEALRNDARFCHVAAWEYQGDGKKPVRHVEPLEFENVHLSQRSYK